MTTLAKNIRYLRKKANLSQEELSKRLGYKSFTTIQKWETGIAEPSILILTKLSEIFDTDITSIASTDLEAKDLNSAFLTPNHIQTPSKYSLLDAEDQAKVDGFIEALLLNPKYKKDIEAKAI